MVLGKNVHLGDCVYISLSQFNDPSTAHCLVCIDDSACVFEREREKERERESKTVYEHSFLSTDKADRTDNHLPTEYWVSTFSLSYFKETGCQLSLESWMWRIERCFCFDLVLLPLAEQDLPCPADLVGFCLLVS